MNRKRKRRIKRIKKSLIIILCLFVTSFLISSAYSTLSQKINVEGNASFVKKDDLEQCKGSIKYEVANWNTDRYYYKLTFTITNESFKNYSGWTIYFDIPDDAILVSYSSVEATINSNKLKADNLYYNGNIAPGDSIQFEIQISTDLTFYEPTNIVLVNCFEDNGSDITTDNIDVQFNLTSSYGTYNYIYDVIVKNIGSDTINNWAFSIYKPDNTYIIDSWNVNYISKNNSITFSNMTYNGIINPKESIAFGIIINTDTSSFSPSLAGES